MRSSLAFASVLIVAACNDEGAHFVLHAPQGPSRATSFQIVLASSELVPMVGNQRIAPAQSSTETVTYYLQRTSANLAPDAMSIDGVEGFDVLLEPSSVTTDAFIPFIVLYDDTKALVGMGTFHADEASPDPSPILLAAGEVAVYPIDIEPVVEVTDADPVVAGQGMRVTCPDANNSTFLSGIVWRPMTGGEARIMLPEDPSSPDATGRQLDMDCDQAVVSPDNATATDCDDTRARFHAGAAELCDGEDTGCDGGKYLLVPCSGSTSCTAANTGYQLCDDTTGTTAGTCYDNSTCACAAGSSAVCHECTLSYATTQTPGMIQPCAPASGVLSAGQLVTSQGCTSLRPCTVEVIGTRGGWDATVASSYGPQATYGPTATGVGDMLWLEVVQQTTGPVSDQLSIGTVELVVTDFSGGTHLVSIELERTADDATTCPGSGSAAQLHCM